MDHDQARSRVASKLNTADSSLPTTGQPRSFFDLPVEIRLAVYEHFAYIPPKPKWSTKKAEDLWAVQLGGDINKQTAKDTVPTENHPTTEDDTTALTARKNFEAHQLITATRHSLLLTCKSVHAEWAPLFWSTATVTLGSTAQTDPATFERQFVARVDEYKLRSIRHLVYCPLRWRPQVRGLPVTTESDCDHSGVLKLGRVLQTYPSLLSGLKGLKVIFQPKGLLPTHYVLNARAGETPGDKWTAMDPGGDWDAFVHMMNGGEGAAAAAAAAAWKAERTIEFEAFRVVPEGGVYCWIAARWELTCRPKRPDQRMQVRIAATGEE
ncbi:hypothetical protein A1O7_04485 [Cladophialophora yegresii CBS 114405]|uniref:Uncharacterized protein n=1 Tax=Cladophialophora yegresii CBS 114405 TaxID=1182544 RepID=W9VXE7_9EURO|nr:uncharacterized protein A1O7_04485 [Cladophialophora yegresii CBS 114405]EXJ60333.1 hypothetical protein A1O7_04485 [Cladophialophora yegresii CBS 114405]